MTDRAVAGLLDAATTRLAAELGLEKREARLEARVLAAFSWNVAPAWLIAHDTDALTAAQTLQFEALLARRLAGEPVAHLTGTREFYGRSFQVSPDVLIPRPDTELLVELALARMPPAQPVEVLDLGTGSGCIAITLALERPLARVTAVERSTAALAIARQNAATLNASVEFLASDWYGALDGRRFDVIVSNPPYIAEADQHLARGDVRFEPREALASGIQGLDDLNVIVRGALDHLAAGGSLLLEHGWNQGAACRTLLENGGFLEIQTLRDLAGHERVTLGRHPG